MYKITENLYVKFTFSEECHVTGTVLEYLITLMSEDCYLCLCGEGIRKMKNILQAEEEKDLYEKKVCTQKEECYFCDNFLTCLSVYDKNNQSEKIHICKGCLKYLEEEYNRIGKNTYYILMVKDLRF